LSLELPCALKIDTLQLWGQLEFSSASSMEAQLILFLKLGMVADNGVPFPIQARGIELDVLKKVC